jgi:hypothetical protein
VLSFSRADFKTPRYICCMRRILFTIAVILFFVPALRAEDDLAGKIFCRAVLVGSVEGTIPPNPSYRKKLWDGYEISLGPVRNAHGDGADCTAAIYNNGGHVVFRTTGFNVIFDENHTGLDFDGDGKPEVVFITDSGGGNHCCWNYNVISLSPKPHRLFDLPLGTQFEKGKSGEMLIWERIQGLTGLTTEARNPGGEKVFRVSRGKLVDATLEFCPQILSPNNADYDQNQRALVPENTRKLASGSEPDDETSSALLSLVYQYTFCRQFDVALHFLNLWPEQTGHPQTARKAVKAAFAESIRQDYPEFAARLMPSGGTTSAQASNAPPRISMSLNLSGQETFLAAKLSAAERKQIIDQVEKTSFDVPDSWDAELRVRRISLGEANGLVIRGTQLLCGGTGNCETWVFRQSQANWFNLFEQEAPVVSGFGFEERATGGIKNFLVSANSSAENETRILFKFDGKFYRQSECYDVSVNASAAARTAKVPCK